jgi:hypothetical protein
MTIYILWVCDGIISVHSSLHLATLAAVRRALNDKVDWELANEHKETPNELVVWRGKGEHDYMFMHISQHEVQT